MIEKEYRKILPKCLRTGISEFDFPKAELMNWLKKFIFKKKDGDEFMWLLEENFIDMDLLLNGERDELFFEKIPIVPTFIFSLAWFKNPELQHEILDLLRLSFTQRSIFVNNLKNMYIIFDNDEKEIHKIIQTHIR